MASSTGFYLILLAGIVDITWGKRLVLMGGAIADLNVDVWSEFVQLSGGAEGIIGVISAASSTPESSANFYTRHLMDYGAGLALWIPIHEGNRDANSDPDIIDVIHTMTGFFFSGGDQARIINSFYNFGVESPALAAIRARYESNQAVIGGSSAGTACQSSGPMIMGGMSWNALRYGAYEYPNGQRDDLEYSTSGIGMIRDFLLDSHFSERGREGRLIRLIADTNGFSNGVSRGIGVDEDTALFIDNVDTASAVGEVFGNNGVFIADLSSASWGNTGGYWSIQDTRGHYLTDGDSINLSTMSVTFASWKSVLDPRYDNGITSERIFNGNRANSNNRPEFVGVSRSLFDARFATSTWGRTENSNPIFRVTFQKGGSSRGQGEYHPLNGRWQIAYTNLNIDMARD